MINDQPRNKILNLVQDHINKYGDIHYVVVPTETMDRLHVLTDYGREKLDSDTLGGHIVINGLKEKLNMAVEIFEAMDKDYNGRKLTYGWHDLLMVEVRKTLKEIKNGKTSKR